MRYINQSFIPVNRNTHTHTHTRSYIPAGILPSFLNFFLTVILILMKQEAAFILVWNAIKIFFFFSFFLHQSQ